MKLLIFLILFSISTSLAADLKPFEAKYSISRDGKKTGEQITRLTQLNDNLWQVEDRIIGTNGLASMIGFTRTETTTFKMLESQFQATKHTMKQKAAFSKKRYEFTWNEVAQKFDIKHKDKNVTYDADNEPVISAQLMPIALARAACQQQQTLQLNVLKNKQPKTYHFTIKSQNPQTAQRVYPAHTQKSTRTWFDETKQCLPKKQVHKDHNEPVIETKLIEFKWL